jgi:predicted dehydrogenase
MKRLLRAGRIGTVTHVSCVDWRARGVESLGSAEIDYVQLLAYGADHLAWIRDLLEVDPVRVMARCGRVSWQFEPHGSLTAAFLEMAGGVHVQYHGSLVSNRDHHELRIDGGRGVLRTDGRVVWFRKTGRSLFVPVAGSLRRWVDAPSPAARAAARRERLGAVERGEALSAVGEDDLWPLAMAEAVVRADRSGRPVAVIERVRAAAPAAAHGSAA